MFNFAVLRNLALVAITLSLTACAASKPVGEWRNPNFSGKLDNILVIGVTSRSTRRRVFEDIFVDALAANETTGLQSYKLITSALTLSRATIEEAIRGRDIGGVLVTRLAGVKEKEAYQPPTDRDENLSYFTYYDNALQQDNPGYYAQYRELTLETNLYDTRTRELVWSMQSEVIERSQPRNIIEDQVSLTISSMRAQGLIGK